MPANWIKLMFVLSKSYAVRVVTKYVNIAILLPDCKICMLLVPKSLVARWSPFASHWIEAENLLTSCIREKQVARVLSLSLRNVDRLGWRSLEAQALYRQACSRLSQWCAEHGRYLHNVSTLQRDLAPDDGISLRTERDRRRLEKPPTKWRFFRRLSEWEARSSERSRQGLRYDQLPTWSMAARQLEPGDAVLAAAPLCMTGSGPEQCSAVLCDYADFVRTPQDVAVPLGLSDDGKRFLLSQPGMAAGAWHPFCRVLGIVRNGKHGLLLDVLQIELATPLPDQRRYSHEAIWDEALIEETASFGYVAREADWARKELAAFDAGKFFREGVFATNGALDSLLEPAREEQLARSISLAGTNTDKSCRALTRQAGSPFEGMDAFWCAVAALLPARQEQFPLSEDKLTALLSAFDKAYGPEWRAITDNPALTGAIRYTPAVMDAVRARIAGIRIAKPAM